ncbi:5-oxoprolinase subunit PxpA [Maritalea sp.]|uniref:5-oxoprolinase subunit PxpA n=1 Tax=Maritalea sp. TaxID=2003361 RepID=UPI003F4A8E6C
MANWIDLNADLGEGTGNDSAMMRYITSANIACGGHAGDETTMRQSIELALENNVAIGAHPGFEDKENFGRIPLELSSAEWRDQITRQLELFDGVARSTGAKIQYVKLHGAMANMTAADRNLANVAYEAVKSFRSNMMILTIANSHQGAAAKALGLENVEEAFADRAYTDEGLLASRSLAGAVLSQEKQVIEHITRLLSDAKVRTITGNVIGLNAKSICLHGDNEHAVALAKSINETVKSLGLDVKSFANKN